MRKPCLILIAFLLVAVATVAEACPGCQAVIAERTSSFSASLAAGFYWSILLLLAVPFALVAGMTWLLLRAARRHAATEAMPHGA